MTGPNGLLVLHRVRLAQGGEPVFAALTAAIPGLSRSQARKAQLAGLLSLDGRVCTDPHAVVPAGGARAELDLRHGLRRAWVKVRHGESPAGKPLEPAILHLDEQLCIADKPSGLASVPPPREAGAPASRRTAHLGQALRRQLQKRGREAGYIGVVHRLDLDTSGCIAVALTRDAHRILAAQFAGTSAVRLYRCIVAGSPRGEQGEIRGKQGRGADGRRALVEDDEAGVEAVTRWRLVRRIGAASELEVELGTGRTHQVRVAMAALGCPVLGDRIYAKGRPDARAPRLMLHAAVLEVDHPRTNRRVRVESPFPEAWRQVVEALGRAPAHG